MKINRLELINKIKVMIKNREDAAASRCALARAEMESQEVNYLIDYKHAWLEFADIIRIRVTSGEAVTIDDVPEMLRGFYGSGVRVFRKTQFQEASYTPKVDHLKNLILVLESSPDEFVTTNMLDRMGAPLRELMRP